MTQLVSRTGEVQMSITAAKTKSVTCKLFRRLFGLLAPPTNLQVSEWADKNRKLRSSTSAESGNWRTSRFPYTKEIMDCLSVDSPVQDICFMKGAQVSGSETGNNWMGYIIDQEPGPAMIVEPTVDLAKRYSRQRIAPMIEDAPSIKRKVKDARSRDSGNTLLCKEFPGGILVITGANSAAGLRSMPVRYIFLDEIDAYVPDVEGEGDPVDLATARTQNFDTIRKILKVSTPTIKNVSRIEAEYNDSDQRRYFVPCPQCGHMHVLMWGNFKIPKDEKGKGSASQVYMVCPECGGKIEERHKTFMLNNGEWRATATDNINPKKRGYHISTLYSPLGFYSWTSIAEQWLKVGKNQRRLKTFINTILGETFEELGEGIEVETLLRRREVYDCEVPDDVYLLTCAVDVQGDRLEYDIKGWGINRERWGIQYGVIMGDPGRADTWSILDGVLFRKYLRKDGQALEIMSTCIDSGGHHTKHVYAYCKKNEFRRVWAIKGKGGSGPFVIRPKKRNEAGTYLFVLNVDVGKDAIASDLLMPEPGQNYCHYALESNRGYDRGYFEGLTAEHRTIHYVRGQSTINWKKRYEGARNEPFDLENYNLAAYEIYNPNIEMIAEALKEASGEREQQTKPKIKTKKRRVISTGVSL